MILSRALENSRTQKYLKSCQVPFVVIGPCKDREIPSVDNENQRASEEMRSIMLMKGSRKLWELLGKQTEKEGASLSYQVVLRESTQ
nr:hypothetical protein [uncultured Blautia sp.]